MSSVGSLRVITRLRASRDVPLYRSSFALMLTTAFNGVLGFLYWILAARLYPAKVVGIGAGAISALILISSLGWIGLQYVLLRFIPVAGSKRLRLAWLTYVAATAVAVLGAVVFLVAFARTAGLGLLARSPLTGIAFTVSVALWVIFSLQDAALIGLRKAGWVPIENAAFGAIKAGLLALMAASASAWAILGAWVLGAAGLIVVINAALFGRLLRQGAGEASALPSRRQLTRFAAGHHFVALILAVPDSLVSLLVLAFLPGSANAYYYSAWAVSFSLRLLAVNMSSALTVEGAHAEDRVRKLVRQVSRLALAVLVPIVVVVVAAAAPIMHMFGHGYGQGVGLLRLFALALIPFSIVNFVIAVERIRQRIAMALLIAATSTVITIGLDLWLIPTLGISGAGVGWLVAQSLAAVVALAAVAREGRSAASDAARADLTATSTAAEAGVGAAPAAAPGDLPR